MLSCSAPHGLRLAGQQGAQGPAACAQGGQVPQVQAAQYRLLRLVGQLQQAWTLHACSRQQGQYLKH